MVARADYVCAQGWVPKTLDVGFGCGEHLMEVDTLQSLVALGHAANNPKYCIAHYCMHMHTTRYCSIHRDHSVHATRQLNQMWVAMKIIKRERGAVRANPLSAMTSLHIEPMRTPVRHCTCALSSHCVCIARPQLPHHTPCGVPPLSRRYTPRLVS